MEGKNRHENGADELHSASAKFNKKFSLDKFFDIITSRDPSLFTAADLNKVISLHGFKKKSRKDELVEVVKEMELMDFSRSTLGECIHPAPMTLTEVVKDLTQLNWQTCHVVSVRSIDSTQHSLSSSTSNRKAHANPAFLPLKSNKNSGPASKALAGASCSSSSRAGEDPIPTNSKRKRSSQAMSWFEGTNDING